MSPESEEPEDYDFPQLIVQMRIYDVLMAIYTEMTADGTGASAKARKLLEAHAQGKILTPMPSWSMEPPESTD